MRRRHLLLGAALGVSLHAARPATAAATVAGPALAAGARAQVLVVGGGFAGLAAAQALAALREASPGAANAAPDVHLVDREPLLRALPLSNPWLAGFTPERLPRIELAAWAGRRGQRFTAGTATALDRGRRDVSVVGADGRTARLRYDFLLLAGGAVPDHAAWFGDDAAAAAVARDRFPAGFVAGELDAAQRGLLAFNGGTLVMTVPPPPLRCPPAPYERALLLAAWLKRRGVAARLVLLDSGGGMPLFNRLLAEAGAEKGAQGAKAVAVEHLKHQRLRRIDPWARRIVTDEGELAFDHALLLPPMRAAALFADAALLGRDAAGAAGAAPNAPSASTASTAPAAAAGSPGSAARWAAVEPLTLRARADARIWVAGDALGQVSALFGAYPKTAQIAAETGVAAALQIAAAARGDPPAPPLLPASACHVWTAAEPPEQVQIDVSHRLRGDGAIVQSVRQTDNPMPRDEDLAWARALFAARLGVAL